MDPCLPLVFSRTEALDAGLSRHAIAHRLSTGRWTTLRRGSYCLATTWHAADTRTRHLLHAAAERLRVPDALALSHESAGVSLGWPVPWAGLSAVWFTDDRQGARPARSADRVVEVARLAAGDIEGTPGGSRTSAPRTAADVLRHLPPEDSVAMVDAAIRLGHTSIDAVREAIDRQTGWPHVQRARHALGLVDGRRETYLESSSVTLLASVGIPLPLCQVHVYDGSGGFVAIVDALWLPAGVVGECDGRTKYDLDVIGRRDPGEVRRQLLREKIREDALRATQLAVVRWGTYDVRHDLAGLARRLRTAASTADLRRFTGTLRMSPSPADTIDLTPYLRCAGESDPLGPIPPALPR